MMKNKLLVQGHEVVTNFNRSGCYSFDAGDGRKTMSLELSKYNETSEEMLERLVTTTRIRGYYDLIAYCA